MGKYLFLILSNQKSNQNKDRVACGLFNALSNAVEFKQVVKTIAL